MHRPRVRNGAALVILLAALVVSCSGGSDTTGGAGEPNRANSATQTPAVPEEAAAETPTEAPSPDDLADRPSPSAEAVRDAFATLQATLNDTCTPANCEYLLTRVHRELMELDAAMKADPKGPGHFPEPIAWIGDLRTALDGDSSFENLKSHQDLLIGTRDKINVWMQDHPDDYR